MEHSRDGKPLKARLARRRLRCSCRLLSAGSQRGSLRSSSLSPSTCSSRCRPICSRASQATSTCRVHCPPTSARASRATAHAPVAGRHTRVGARHASTPARRHACPPPRLCRPPLVHPQQAVAHCTRAPSSGPCHRRATCHRASRATVVEGSEGSKQGVIFRAGMKGLERRAGGRSVQSLLVCPALHACP